MDSKGHNKGRLKRLVILLVTNCEIANQGWLKSSYSALNSWD